MATLEELYEKAAADEAESEAWAKAQGEPGGVAAFLAARGCDATPAQVEEFLRARLAPQGELADEELDSVAGGCGGSNTVKPTCPACGQQYLGMHSCRTVCKNCGKTYTYNFAYSMTSCPSCGEKP